MNDLVRRLSLYFSAGCVGGFINSLAVWLFGILGITSALGVKIAPALTPAWLYPRIVWGGLWGFAFLIPLLKVSRMTKGLILSLGPTLVQLFVIFPLKANKGAMGIELGMLTPVLVILFNAVWGVSAAMLLKSTGEE